MRFDVETMTAASSQRSADDPQIATPQRRRSLGVRLPAADRSGHVASKVELSAPASRRGVPSRPGAGVTRSPRPRCLKRVQRRWRPTSQLRWLGRAARSSFDPQRDARIGRRDSARRRCEGWRTSSRLRSRTYLQDRSRAIQGPKTLHASITGVLVTGRRSARRRRRGPRPNPARPPADTHARTYGRVEGVCVGSIWPVPIRPAGSTASRLGDGGQGRRVVACQTWRRPHAERDSDRVNTPRVAWRATGSNRSQASPRSSRRRPLQARASGTGELTGISGPASSSPPIRPPSRRRRSRTSSSKDGSSPAVPAMSPCEGLTTSTRSQRWLRRGRLELDPSVVREEDLRPRVRIALTHQKCRPAVVWCPLCETGGDASRDPQRAQQQHLGARVPVAEANPMVE